MGRISIMQTNPFHSGDIRNTFNQFRQRVPFIYIFSVISQILGDHLKFFYTLCHKQTDLFFYLLHRKGLVMSGTDRNGTIGTSSVTPLRYFQKGIMFRGGQYTVGSQFTMIRFTDISKELLPVEFTVKAVYLRQFLFHFLQKTFGETSHYIQLADFSFFLGFTQFQNHVYRFFLRITDKTASINDNDLPVYFMRIMLHRITVSYKLTHQLFRINQILRTPKRYDIYFIFPHIILRTDSN